MTGKPAALLDRDGTLIRDVGYLSRREQMEILPRVCESLRLLRRGGLKIVVVTNQSAVARGFLTETELKEIHRDMERAFARYGAYLDGIYYCPHHPCKGVEPYRTSCSCRKPRPGLAQRAAAELQLDLRRSYVVGDQASDMELAAVIGARGMRLHPQASGREACSAAIAVEDLWEAAQWIVRDLREKNRRPR